MPEDELAFDIKFTLDEEAPLGDLESQILKLAACPEARAATPRPADAAECLGGKDEYVGELDSSGKRTGVGRLSFADGTYEGSFLEGSFNGKGVLRLQTGNTYEGDFKNGKFHGIGKMMYRSGKVYTGQMANGVPDGYGVEDDPSGFRYEGIFERGKREGIGRAVFSDPHPDSGCVYHGQWYDGHMQGDGVWTDAREVRHKGKFRDGKRHGMFLAERPGGKVFREKYSHGELLFKHEAARKATSASEPRSSVYSLQDDEEDE